MKNLLKFLLFMLIWCGLTYLGMALFQGSFSSSVWPQADRGGMVIIWVVGLLLWVFIGQFYFDE